VKGKGESEGKGGKWREKKREGKRKGKVEGRSLKKSWANGRTDARTQRWFYILSNMLCIALDRQKFYISFKNKVQIHNSPATLRFSDCILSNCNFCNVVTPCSGYNTNTFVLSASTTNWTHTDYLSKPNSYSTTAAEKRCITLYGKPIAEIRSVTCHMDHTVLPVTWHRWTHPSSINKS